MEGKGSPIHPSVREEMKKLGELSEKLCFAFSTEPDSETHPYHAVKRLHELMYSLKKVEKAREEPGLMRLREAALDDAYKLRQNIKKYKKANSEEKIGELDGCKRALAYSLRKYLERLETSYSSCYHSVKP